MTAWDTKKIPPGSLFSAPVYLDEGFVLASPETPLGAELLRALEEWEFPQVLSAGEFQEGRAGEPAAGKDRLKEAEDVYQSLLGYVERLYMRAAIGMDLELREIAEKVKSLCALVREDRRLLLRLQRHGDSAPGTGGTAFLAAHTVKSTILSLVMGLFLKLPDDQLVELGIAALVHEIGMVKVPQRIYSAQRALSPVERGSIFGHPQAGYHILRGSNFPMNISLAALQHHERENGSGYPQMITGNRINPYAKIIAVACSYEALTADRPHRDAKDGHTGIMDLLKNEGKPYDDRVIRALVYSLSIYPIGLYVLLSSGQTGQVVEVNPEDPRFPLVRVLGEGEKISTTSPNGLRILRPLTREEISRVSAITP